MWAKCRSKVEIFWDVGPCRAISVKWLPMVWRNTVYPLSGSNSPRHLLRTVTTCIYQSAWLNISGELDPKQHRSGTLNVAKCKLDVLVQQNAINIGNTILKVWPKITGALKRVLRPSVEILFSRSSNFASPTPPPPSPPHPNFKHLKFNLYRVH